MCARHQYALPGRVDPLRRLAIRLEEPSRENSEASYYRARYYDPTPGRFLSEDKFQSSAESSLYDYRNLYVYVENSPIDFADPLGLFTVKPGVPYPSPRIQALLDCIEFKTLLPLEVTSTSEINKYHPPNTPHTNGLAVDLHYPGPVATQSILCAAAGCGAGFGLDESKHPSHPDVVAHIHLQIPTGRNGGHGDLPVPNCHSCER
jgi:RHS repeat-associated protein